MPVFFAHGQEDHFLKKLGVLEKKTWSLHDSALINRLNTIAVDRLFSNTLKAQKYSQLTQRFSDKIEYSEGIILSLRNPIRSKNISWESKMNRCQTSQRRSKSPSENGKVRTSNWTMFLSLEFGFRKSRSVVSFLRTFKPSEKRQIISTL